MSRLPASSAGDCGHPTVVGFGFPGTPDKRTNARPNQPEAASCAPSDLPLDVQPVSGELVSVEWASALGISHRTPYGCIPQSSHFFGRTLTCRLSPPRSCASPRLGESWQLRLSVHRCNPTRQNRRQGESPLLLARAAKPPSESASHRAERCLRAPAPALHLERPIQQQRPLFSQSGSCSCVALSGIESIGIEYFCSRTPGSQSRVSRSGVSCRGSSAFTPSLPTLSRPVALERGSYPSRHRRGLRA